MFTGEEGKSSRSVIRTHHPNLRHETLKLTSLRRDRPVKVRGVAEARGKRLDRTDKPVVLLQDVERVRTRSNSPPQTRHRARLRALRPRQQPRNPVRSQLLRRRPRSAPPVPCASDGAPCPCSG